jgi:hypothetical protein
MPLYWLLVPSRPAARRPRHAPATPTTEPVRPPASSVEVEGPVLAGGNALRTGAEPALLSGFDANRDPGR